MPHGGSTGAVDSTETDLTATIQRIKDLAAARTSAMAPDPAAPRNTYVREDKLLPHLPALHLLLTSPAVRARRRTRAGTDVIRSTVSPAEVIRYLREHEITLTWNPAAAALQTRATQTAKTVTVTAR